MSDSVPRKQRPFLKWAGGKYRLIERITAKLPRGRRLIEPFVGSGAVFMNTVYDHYLLADKNPDLIGLYRTLQREGGTFIDACRELFVPANNDAEVYYALREEFNAATDPFRRAMLFVYLNRFGFNGLCRYNRRGGFNVPFGRYKQPPFPHREILAFARKLQQAELREADFAAVLDEAGPGDVVYCDPPYQPLSDTANFTAYSAGGFGEREQTLLARLAGAATARGATVLVSNHNVRGICDEYRRAGASISRFEVRRSISAGERGMAGEILALFAAAS